MITLLAPWGLAALAAALVPLTLHWVRRSDRQLRSFAAMRYLRERPHAREKFRLHERLLLLVRLLLIGSVAILLSLPAWRSRVGPQAPWIVVAPGIDAASAHASIVQPGAEWRRLAPGFPALDATSDGAAASQSIEGATALPIEGAAEPPRHAAASEPRDAAVSQQFGEADASLTSLIRELDSELAPGTALMLVVPAELSGLDAERLQLARPVVWRVLAGTTPQVVPEPAWEPVPNQVSNPVPNAVQLTVAVRYDPADATELPLVRALATAWQADGMAFQLDIAARTSPLPPPPAWLLWLGTPAPPDLDSWVHRGGSVLLTQHDTAQSGEPSHAGDAAGSLERAHSSDPSASSAPAPAADSAHSGDAAGSVVLADGNGAAILRERLLGTGRVLSLAGPLRIDVLPALAAPDFPRQLAALLRGPPPAPDRAPAASVAPLTLPSAHPTLGRPQPLTPYLALVIALLFLVERVVATRARTRRSVASSATAARV
jgi:hypothetical protein